MATTGALPEIQFDELLQLVSKEEDEKTGGKDDFLLLIDVREESELRESGWIPTAVHIPLGELEVALNLPLDEFEKKYKKAKPKKEEEEELKTPEFVIYCRSGRRAILAHQICAKLGYEKARCYKGSFLEWTSKGGPIITK